MMSASLHSPVSPSSPMHYVAEESKAAAKDPEPKRKNGAGFKIKAPVGVAKMKQDVAQGKTRPLASGVPDNPLAAARGLAKRAQAMRREK